MWGSSKIVLTTSVNYAIITISEVVSLRPASSWQREICPMDS